MFEYTRMYLEELLQKIKKLGLFIKYLFSIAFIIIFAYSISTGRGNSIVNIILLSTNALYFIYQVLTENKKGKKVGSQKKLAKNVKDWIGISKSAYEAGISVYGLIITVSSPTTVSIIMTIVNVVMCLLKIIFELLEYVIENYVKKIGYAFLSDVDDIKHPFRNKAEASIIVEGMNKEEIAKAKFRQEYDNKMELWQNVNKEKGMTKKEEKRLGRLNKKEEKQREKEIRKKQKTIHEINKKTGLTTKEQKKLEKLKEKQAKKLAIIQKKQQKQREKIQNQIDEMNKQ